MFLLIKEMKWKSLKSTETDKVFLYFSDHRAAGLIASVSKKFFADDLIDALMYISTNKLYKRLIFYLELVNWIDV